MYTCPKFSIISTYHNWYVPSLMPWLFTLCMALVTTQQVHLARIGEVVERIAT